MEANAIVGGVPAQASRSKTNDSAEVDVPIVLHLHGYELHGNRVRRPLDVTDARVVRVAAWHDEQPQAVDRGRRGREVHLAVIGIGEGLHRPSLYSAGETGKGCPCGGGDRRGGVGWYAWGIGATYFAEAWGNTYEPLAQRQPRLMTTRVAAPEQLGEIRPVDGRSGVFAYHLYALRLLVDEVGDQVDIVHTVFSPLAVAAQLCGLGTEFTRYAAANPSGVHAAVAAVASTLTEYSLAALTTGASGIFFAPLAWASRDTASDDFYREFGRPYDLQVLGAIAGAPFNILHVCRNQNMIDLLLDYPVAAFNWADQGDGNPSLTDVKARIAGAVMGGIDQNRLPEMSPTDVKAQARRAVASVPSSLFLTAGCAIRPETPAANREAVAASARS